MLLPLLTQGVPPLTSGQETRLAAARDGTDHQEEAFLALAESFAGWSGQIGDAPLRLAPDYAAMLLEPQRYRGDLCRVVGTIQQRAELSPPYDVAEEWFLRTDDGRPIVVYVTDVGDLPEAAVRSGRTVGLVARFYKRVTFTARDGVRRDYPAFVGALPSPVGRDRAGSARLWIVAVPVLILIAAFLVLLVYTRRRGDRLVRRPAAAVDDLEEPPLPEEPDEALAELRRRAQEE